MSMRSTSKRPWYGTTQQQKLRYLRWASLKGRTPYTRRKVYRRAPFAFGVRKTRRAIAARAPQQRSLFPKSAGALGPKLAGLGEYTIRSNTLMKALDMGMDPPRVNNTNKGEATIVKHREYVQDITSGTGNPSAFKRDDFSVNPGNSTLFPWLSSIAINYQEYEIRGMIVEIKTLSTDFSTSFSLGSVFASADYNVLGPDPANKQQIENMEYASSAKPSCSIILPIECDPRNDSNTHLYVAKNNDYQGGDRRLFDLCKIYIGSQGLPAATGSTIAELWISYEVALFKPIIQGNIVEEEVV